MPEIFLRNRPSSELSETRPDDDDQRPGQGQQHVGNGVGARVAERGDVAPRGVADNLHCRGAGAGSHHRAEEHGAVHPQHVGAEQEADHHRYQTHQQPGDQHLSTHCAKAVADAAPGAQANARHKDHQAKLLHHIQRPLRDVAEGGVVGTQEAEHDPGEQQTRRVADAKAKRAELEGDHADHQTDDKEGTERQQVGYLAVNRDKADAVSDGFYPSRVSAHLQHVAFVKHDAVIDRHLNLAADHPVKEAAMIGELQLGEAAAYHVVVFHHNLFGDDAHVEQVAVKDLFAVAEAGIEAGMGVRITYQRDLIAHLQHRIAVRGRQNAVAANTLDVAPGLTVDPQLAQVLTVGPGYQLRPHAVGADHRKINFTVGIVVEAALAGNLLGAGLKILML